MGRHGVQGVDVVRCGIAVRVGARGVGPGEAIRVWPEVHLPAGAKLQDFGVVGTESVCVRADNKTAERASWAKIRLGVCRSAGQQANQDGKKEKWPRTKGNDGHQDVLPNLAPSGCAFRLTRLVLRPGAHHKLIRLQLAT